MKLADLYARPGLTLSVEFFPPKTEKGEENLFSEIEIIKRLNPGFCSVTYGAGGSTREKTVDLVETILTDYGLEVMCHLTVVGQSKDDARAVLRSSKEKGLKIFLRSAAIHPRGWRIGSPIPTVFTTPSSWFAKRSALGGFSIAVAGFPGNPSESGEPDVRFKIPKGKSRCRRHGNYYPTLFR